MVVWHVLRGGCMPSECTLAHPCHVLLRAPAYQGSVPRALVRTIASEEVRDCGDIYRDEDTQA